MSENVRKCPGFVDEFLFFLGGFEELGGIAAEYGSKIRCIYIQVQKVHVLYLFLRNPGIFLKIFLGVADIRIPHGGAVGVPGWD